MLAIVEQPAYKIYPCDRGWRIIRYVKDNAFAKTGEAADWWFSRGRDFMERKSDAGNIIMKFWLLCVAGGFYLAGYSQYLSTWLFMALFMLIQVVVIGVWFAISGLMILALTGVNLAYGAWYKAHFRCPGCHEAMEIPVFTCPTCATDHTRLWPSVYGVLGHTCSVCKTTRLPTLERNGRREVPRKCPHCSRPLNADIGMLTNIHVPVVGGPSTGKSNFIVMATADLLRNGEAFGLSQVGFPDPMDQREFEANLQLLSQGRELLKTTSIVPQAYNLSIRRERERVGKIVYFYDAAGEAYSDETSTMQQTYYEFVDGIIFVIDPFTLPDLQHELGAEIDSVRQSLRPSPIGVMEAYERMLDVLEANVGLTRGKGFRHPLAVVLTKVDALDLEAKVGAAPARDLLLREPELGSESEAMNVLVQRFLETYGLDHFVRDARLQFETVRYFSCSALGRMPDERDSSPFIPIRVSEPLQWVLGQLAAVDQPMAALPAPDFTPSVITSEAAAD